VNVTLPSHNDDIEPVSSSLEAALSTPRVYAAQVYRQQAATTRLNEFSIPQRYYSSVTTTTLSTEVSPKPSHAPQRPDLATATRRLPSNTSDGSLSQKEIHELKVKVVTLKQRARLARGESRTKILEELAATRSRLAESSSSVGRNAQDSNKNHVADTYNQNKQRKKRQHPSEAMTTVGANSEDGDRDLSRSGLLDEMSQPATAELETDASIPLWSAQEEVAAQAQPQPKRSNNNNNNKGNRKKRHRQSTRQHNTSTKDVTENNSNRKLNSFDEGSVSV